MGDTISAGREAINMILTYKIRYGMDFSEQLKRTGQVAEFGRITRSITSKDTGQFAWLTSMTV